MKMQDNMIIVKIKGGLGNQMFQYALGRRLSYHHNVPLKLDLSFYNDPESETTSRSYRLNYFNIIGETASESDIAGLEVVKEKHFHFDPNVLKVPKNVCLEGFWQSEKYFKAIEPILRKEFTPKYPLSSQSVSVADRIKASNAVSMHIRRGDYIAKYQHYFHVFTFDYYKDSIKKIRCYVKSPHFFIFSDDQEWVRANIQLEYPFTIIDYNKSERDYEDLYLMSLCKHHIIANSAFSWWGAWLCKNKDKIVIASKKWFIDQTINTKDLLPSGWVRT